MAVDPLRGRGDAMERRSYTGVGRFELGRWLDDDGVDDDACVGQVGRRVWEIVDRDRLVLRVLGVGEALLVRPRVPLRLRRAVSRLRERRHAWIEREEVALLVVPPASQMGERY